jgi:phage-related protein
MILDEFLVKLGVISDPKDLDTFVGGLQKAATVATAVVGVVGGATAAITNFFGAALEGLDGLNDLAQDTDTDLAYIQKLGYAAQLSGSSVEAANASVKGLAQTIGEAASGLGRGKQAFEAYGLSAKNADGSIKSVGQVLDDVQAKMANLSKAEQLSMLQKLGIDQSMIGLLNSTNAEMGELFQQAEDLGLVTAAGADAAGEFNDTMDQMNMVMGAIRTNISVGLAPQLTNIVARLRDWLIRNKELIREGIDKAVSVILSLWRAIMRAVDVIDLIISKTIGWKAVLLILGAALVWFNKTMLLAFATNPITLIAGAIAGLILLVDDLITFLEGGESMFDWSWAVPIIDQVRNAIDAVSAVLSDLWAIYGENVQAGFAGLWEFIKGFVAWLGNAIAAVFNLMTGDIDGFLSRSQASLEGLKQMFQGAWDYILNGFKIAMKVISGIWEGVSGAIGAGIDKIGGAISWLGDKLGLTSETAAGAVQQVNAASDTVAAAQAGANPVNSQSTVNNSESTTVSAPVQVTQHISTSDPKAAGDHAAAQIKREQQRATENYRGAVKG